MIGKNIRHDSGMGHVTGESVFIDDRIDTTTEVHVGLISAKVAKGILKNIDDSLAKEHPDYLGLWQVDSLAAKKWGTIIHEQPLIVESEISYFDEVLGVFASRRRESIEEIKKLFKVEIEEQEPILSIDEAKKQDSIIYAAPEPFAQGDIDAGFAKADHIIENTVECGGQEHFYMESQACVVYPGEFGQMEVHSSSQHPSETQRLVAEALGLPFHHVVCIVKRMGGGFGGKESQAAPIAAYAALVARDLNCPARLVLTKDDDMKITGKRHPFKNEYKVGFTKDGVITAFKATLQGDGGAYADLSASILERAMFHCDGAYYLENCYIKGICYRTNNHPNTAFRGFGGPQGNLTIEAAIEDIAHFLKKDAFNIRKLNRYEGERNKTPYAQVVKNNMLPKLFDELHIKADYEKRRKEIESFNANRTGKIRGLSMSATKFGIAFTARFLNQGNALVNLQIDGTVQASTGATEMGQGVNTKIQQIVAHAFGLHFNDVQVMTTSTEKNHNTSPTAASSGSDINGAAALAACNKIKAKLTSLAKEIWNGAVSNDEVEFEIGKGELDPEVVFKENKIIHTKLKKELDFKEVVSTAYFNRISLGARAHFKTPDLGFCKNKIKGRAFNYYTQGTALAEVEVCEYTGEMKVLRTDIYMDLGRMLNPGIDEGQVTGAFIQGMGWLTTEQLFYSDKGELLSHSPTTYKIPNIQDTPRVFNIDFITNDDVDNNVHRSKAVGEPPFVLGISVWTAIKDALKYRSEKQAEVKLNAPATNEEILNELTRLKTGNGFK